MQFEPLDLLLAKDEYVNLLRLCRNGTFHYQKDPLTEKVVGILHKEDSETWVRSVNKQLQALFLEALPIKEKLSRLEARHVSN